MCLLFVARRVAYSEFNREPREFKMMLKADS